MRLLIDTHALIWAVEQPSKLSATAGSALRDPGNELLLSAGTMWEISIKVGLKKLHLSRPYRVWIEDVMVNLDIALLPITVNHADAQAALPMHHRDPFDRLLAAQARVDQVPLVSADAKLDPFGIVRVW